MHERIKGIVFSKQDASPDPDKNKIFKEWPAPEEMAAEKSFLQCSMHENRTGEDIH